MKKNPAGIRDLQLHSIIVFATLPKSQDLLFSKVGDRIGMVRKSNADLHLYINGLDQGIAATKVPTLVWGVVDLYGMTVKVIVDVRSSGLHTLDDHGLD